jgi:hypothetical protein
MRRGSSLLRARLGSFVRLRLEASSWTLHIQPCTPQPRALLLRDSLRPPLVEASLRDATSAVGGAPDAERTQLVLTVMGMTSAAGAFSRSSAQSPRRGPAVSSPQLGRARSQASSVSTPCSGSRLRQAAPDACHIRDSATFGAAHRATGQGSQTGALAAHSSLAEPPQRNSAQRPRRHFRGHQSPRRSGGAPAFRAASNRKMPPASAPRAEGGKLADRG